MKRGIYTGCDESFPNILDAHQGFLESRRTPWPETRSYSTSVGHVNSLGDSISRKDGARSSIMVTDREIFLGLVDEHGAAVLALLRRLCGRGQDAEDLFQDVAVRVWRNLGSRPTLRNPRGWLMTIAYRVYLDHQAETPRFGSLAVNEALPARGGRDQDPAVLTERREQCAIVQEAVAELSSATRSVVALHYAGGLSLKEIAKALGISVGTVKSRLNSGLEQLRRRLS